MPDNLVKILSCGQLDQELIDEAEKNNLQVDIESFIHIEPAVDIERQAVQKLSQKKITAIFTSQNAVKQVTAVLQPFIPGWDIYCIAGLTEKNLALYFGAHSIRGTETDAGALAELVISKDIHQAVFFCGDRRRNELPELLAEKKLMLNEIVVYHTRTLRKKLQRDYDAVLFYSPSAVTQFFLDNEARAAAFFAIGSTTADAIKKYTDNIIHTSPAAEKKTLVKEVIRHFLKSSKNSNEHGISSAK